MVTQRTKYPDPSHLVALSTAAEEKPTDGSPTPAEKQATDGSPTVSVASPAGTPHGSSTLDNTAIHELPTANSVLGSYKLISELARGGMGVVFKAQGSSGKVVALKTIRFDRGASSEYAQRFAREIQAAQQLKHPNIMPIYDVGMAAGCQFFTMEFVVQGSLSKHRARFQSDPRATVRLVEQVARGVQHAHDNGILHRDLKPGNILLAANDTPLVSDFGLAKFVDGDGDLTRTGQLVGTPAYMAPEQATGRVSEISTRTDVWSLGVILYELLAGRRPFRADDDVELIQQIQADPPTRPSTLSAAVPPALEAVVLKCLEKNPADRYASAQELADDLSRWLASRPVTLGRPSWPRRITRNIVRHPWRTAAGLLGIVIVIAALIVVPRLDPERPRRTHEQQLAAGRAVEWIPAKGFPTSPQVLVGTSTASGEISTDGFFGMNALDIWMCEFLPDPQCTRYRLHGWVRQVDNVEDGLVGFYFAHSKRPAGAGISHCYGVFGFAEDNVEAGRVRLDLLHHSVTKGDAPALSRAGTPVNRTLPPNERALGTWRELAVEVSPEKIVASFDGKIVGELPRATLDFRIGMLTKRLPNLNPAPAFAPREGLGLYVYRGTASFRSVTITPLPAANP